MLKTRSECLEEYGSDYSINRLVDEGKLYKVDKGMYSEEEYVPELAILAHRYPKGIITMDTAFYLYGLTDEVRMHDGYEERSGTDQGSQGQASIHA